MKTFLTIFGWLAVVTFFGIAWMVYSVTRITRDELALKKVVLAEKPKAEWDEYGDEITSVKFKAVDETFPYSISGNLFRASQQGILDLEKGDEIEFHTYQKSDNFFLKPYERILFSLKDKQQTYIKVDQGLEHFTSTSMILISLFFLIAGLTIAYFLIPKGN
ncbi:MAG: hypothetical protein AAFY71_04545 [Bacteroidota bacterium]